jgi:cytochrome c peroxidase
MLLGLATASLFAQPPPAAPPVEFDPATLRRILALGPWPPPSQRDPSNRVSGDAAAIAFGAALFADKRLSGTGTLACADCHQPQRSFSDGLPQARGLAPIDRNSTSLGNVGGQRWYGWDGANDNLWAQSLRPLLDPREMGSSLSHLAAAVRGDADLRTRYVAVFGMPPPADDEALAVDLAKALAAYQETLVTGRTPFDAFRDALARGDAVAAARYPAAARRGLALFVGDANCSFCHSGPRFSNGEFHDVGIAFFVAPGRVDPGRHEGIRRLRASRYNLLGPFNDDPARSTATSTRYVALEHRNFGEFKVPSLRNVARTAPYMHNGSLVTLRDVVRHYANIDEDRLHADGERILKPLGLDKYGVDDLVAFLESLSESIGVRAPAPIPTPMPNPAMPLR